MDDKDSTVKQEPVAVKYNSFTLSEIGVTDSELSDTCLVIRNLPQEFAAATIGDLREWFKFEYDFLFETFEKLTAFYSDSDKAYSIVPWDENIKEPSGPTYGVNRFTQKEWAVLLRHLNTEVVCRLTPNTPEVQAEKFRVAQELARVIGPVPADWKGTSDDNPNFRAIASLSAPEMRKIEPYGAQFLAFARRKRHGRTFSEDERIQAQSRVKKIEEQDDDDISDTEDPSMLQRDAKDWRGQDHYAVLGLAKYRYKATDDQIKRAHRKKVLKHHPDKKAAAGKSDENDSFFKCIQKAHEILTDPVKRRQFDSVDEEADVDPPTKKDMQKPGNFYKKWRPVFESEARFSNKHPVPMLGDDNSTKEDVEDFYNFWYDFDSWRTFEYLDEDVPDDNEGRDHKRHVEKKNANARRKRKTEDIARLRKLVDDCMTYDERIKKFKKEERASKNKKKIEREEAEKKAAEEKAKAKEAEELAKKEEEEKAKANKEASKKVKEAAKNAAKKNKRVVRNSVKDVNYFAQGDASAQQIQKVSDDVDRVLSSIDAEDLASLVEKLNVAGKDADKVREAFAGKV